MIDSLSGYLYCNLYLFWAESWAYNRQLPVIAGPAPLGPIPTAELSNQWHVKFVDCKVTPKSRLINGGVSDFDYVFVLLFL